MLPEKILLERIKAILENAESVGSVGNLPTWRTSAVFENGFVLTTDDVILYSMSVINTSGTTQYIQIYKDATATVPIAVYPVGTGLFQSWGNGRRFPDGVYICNSSTVDTKTIGAADCWFEVAYAKTI